MKNLFKILSVLVFAACSSKTSNETSTKIISERKVASIKNTASIYAPIETILADLNYDKVKDTILLLNKPEEPGLFKTIGIKLSGNKAFTFNAKYAWDKVDDAFLNKHPNLVESKSVFINQFGKESYILLFGFTYGSSRDEFSIIQISDKDVKMLFDGDIEEIVAFQDLNNDAQLDLVAHNRVDIADSIESKLKIPDGYYVFSIAKHLKFNLPLSQKYNAENPFIEE